MSVPNWSLPPAVPTAGGGATGRLQVLIVEDSPAVAALLEAALHSEGMATHSVLGGVAAVAAKLRVRPDVVLIDLGLPDIDGLALIRRFAEDGDCGIIVVTGDAAEGVRIAGLDNGADDYVVKPPRLKELAARIRAVHRRLTRRTLAGALASPQVTLDCAHRCLTGPDRLTTPLTEAEFSALRALLEARGSSVSRDDLGRIALRRALSHDDRSVDQLVLKLRRKLALHGVAGRSILSSRGRGYIIPNPERFVVTGAEPGRGKPT